MIALWKYVRGPHLFLCLACALVAIPWLNPYARGPSPEVWTSLISVSSASFLYLLRQRLDARAIAAGWLVAATISALLGLLQYFVMADNFGIWVAKTNPGTAFANLRQPNQFATLTSIGLIALIGWLTLSQRKHHVPAWAKYLALLLALGNGASGSRTGLLQWVFILILVAWWGWREHRGVVGVAFQALLFYALAAVALPWLLEFTTNVAWAGLWERFGQRPTCASRLVLWSNVLTLISEKPWFGWGWGELKYAHFVTLYPGTRFCDVLGNAHNLPLHLAVELGIPLAALLFGGFVAWVWGQRPWAEKNPSRQLAWSVIGVILLHSMLEYPLWYGPFQLAFGLSLWILFTSERKAAARQAEHMGATVIAPLMMILTCVYVAWDYHRISQIYRAPPERTMTYREDTLHKIRGSWLFRKQVQFAELSMTPLMEQNAQWTFDLAKKMLHFSPEPRVVQKVIESALILGQKDEIRLQLARYRAAFPLEYQRWRSANIQSTPEMFELESPP